MWIKNYKLFFGCQRQISQEILITKLFFECQWQTCKIKQALETSQLQLSSGVDQLAPVSTAAVAAGSADQSSI